MEKFTDIVWRKQDLFQFFDKAASYVPSLGLMAMGSTIANDYGVTGRIDLLAGGSMIALLGAGIADITSGKNFMSRAFNKIASVLKNKEPVSQGSLLTYLGIGSCAVLAGGEAITYAFTQDALLLKDFLSSSSMPKIAANVAPYMAVSLLEIPSIFSRVNKHLSGDTISILKTAANLAGSALIINFARKANLPVIEAVGMLQVTTILAGQLFWLQKLNPDYFMPASAMSRDEEREFYKNLVETGKLASYQEAEREMRLKRGLFTELDLQRIDKKTEHMMAARLLPEPKDAAPH